MAIVYRPHLVRRLKERKTPQNYPRRIYKESKVHFLDTETSHNIAVFELEYAEKIRPMTIAYDIIHPTSEGEIKRRVNSGRWVKK